MQSCIGRSLDPPWLQAVLKEAERAANERPLAVLVEECQAFIISQNRLARLKEQRAKQDLDAAMGRMAKFQVEMAKSIPVAPTAKSELCTASTQDSTEGRSWRLSSSAHWFEGSIIYTVVFARRVVAWGARGVRVGETRNPGRNDMLEQTQLESGAHSSEETGV